MKNSYNKYIHITPLKELEFDVTKSNKKPSDLMKTKIIFKIEEDFDLKNLKEAYSTTYEFDMFVCSKNKWLEIISFYKENEVIMQKDGEPLLFGIDVKVV